MKPGNSTKEGIANVFIGGFLFFGAGSLLYLNFFSDTEYVGHYPFYDRGLVYIYLAFGVGAYYTFAGLWQLISRRNRPG